MRKSVLLILTNACLLIAIFGLLAQSLFVVQRVANVREVRGRVEVQRGGSGSFSPLTEGAAVKIGDVVRTATNSAAEFSWLDGTRWKLLNNGELTIRKASYSSTRKSEVSRLELTEGRVLVRVSKSLPDQSRFEIETPSALTVTHGKVFSVQVVSGFTSVDVFKGTVSVIANQGGNETVVEPGRQAVESAFGWKVKPQYDRQTFLAEPDFTRPRLEVKVTSPENGIALLNGHTEADSTVMIDGEKVPVLGTGAFVRRVKLNIGKNDWKIESTDPYGASSSMTANLDFAPTCSH